MKNIRGLMVGSSLIAAVAFVPHAAYAQDTETSDAGPVVDEIIVTAQFREQRLQDTPLAITAVSGEMLEARNQTNITDVSGFAPNVNLSQSTALQANSVNAFIRGIGQDDASFALEPGVGIYVDDVYSAQRSVPSSTWWILSVSRFCAAPRARWPARTPLAVR